MAGVGVEGGGRKKGFYYRSPTVSSQLGNMNSVLSSSLAIEKVRYDLAMNIYPQQWAAVQITQKTFARKSFYRFSASS